jgi:hypothetical protein
VDFKRTFAAIEFAREKGLDNTEVVLWFDNPEYDISLPVPGVQDNGEQKRKKRAGRPFTANER